MNTIKLSAAFVTVPLKNQDSLYNEREAIRDAIITVDMPQEQRHYLLHLMGDSNDAISRMWNYGWSTFKVHSDIEAYKADAVQLTDDGAEIIRRIQLLERITEINKLKKGDYFRFPGRNTVYVYEGYNRSTRKYSYYKFDDVCAFGEKKKGCLVEIGFTF